MLIYRYGLLAWFWRVLILLGVAVGGLFFWLGSVDRSIFLMIFGVGFAAFPLLLGQMVATRVFQLPDNHLHIYTLLLTRRTIAVERLGRVHYRSYAQSDVGGINAPRIWVMVQGGLPIYVDLLAHIPEREAFDALFPVKLRKGPRRRGRQAPGNDWDVPF